MNVLLLRADGLSPSGGPKSAAPRSVSPEAFPTYLDLSIARADRLAQLSRLRREIRELQDRVRYLEGEEMELGMRLDHLKAKHPGLPR